MRSSRIALLGEQVLGALVRLLDDAPDLVVDLAGDLFGVLGLLLEVAAHEGLDRVVAEGEGAELLAHAVVRDHLLAVLVARCRSLDAPVVMSSKTISSATRPPSVSDSLSMISPLVTRNLSSVGRVMV